jgi:hypothetical protein
MQQDAFVNIEMVDEIPQDVLHEASHIMEASTMQALD